MIRRIVVAVMLCVLASTAAGVDSAYRVLKRAIVTHCAADAQPAPQVVFLAEGQEEPPAVEGDPPEVGCAVIDSRTSPMQMQGDLTVFGPMGGQIDELLIDVRIAHGGNVYRFSDWASALRSEANGALYIAESIVRFDTIGAPIEYPVRLMRRTPDRCMETGGTIAPCRDRVTMLFLTLAPGVTALLDFRPDE